MIKTVNFLSILLLSASLIAQTPRYSSILDFGAKNDGKTLITQNIKAAIDSLSKQGGGTLFFPAGEYLTGPIVLKSNITINIDAGAVIHFSDNFDDYLPFVETRWEGTVMRSFSPLFYAIDAENIAITGRGKIDGQGKKWWNEHLRLVSELRNNGKILNENKYQKLWTKENPDLKVSDYYKSTINIKFFRPPFIQTFRCKKVLVEGITIVNSPFWTVNPEFTENVTVRAITINNPLSPNTDGINPESCKNVHISDCHISVGDDCITIKSGRDEDGRKYNVPCENITITNCTMLNGHGGVVIGSEMSGGVRNITIANCVFDGTDRGIRIKSMRGRGGVVENIRVNNIVMRDIKNEAMTLDLFYGKSEEAPVSELTPCFKNIHISNVTGYNVMQACKIIGIKEMPISNISFNNINMESKIGFSIETAKDIELHDIEINTSRGPAIQLTDVNYSIIDNIKTSNPIAGVPLISIDNCKNMFVHSCFPYMGTDIFMNADGASTSNIVLMDNNLIFVKDKLVKTSSIKSGAIVLNN